MRLFRFSGLTGWKNTIREFTLIVVGVLVALAGNAWWQERQDRGKEAQELQQLLAAAKENEIRVDSALREDTVRYAAGFELGMVTLGAKTLPPADSTEKLMQNAQGFSDFHPLIDAFSALEMTGDLNLIRSGSLRRALVDYAGEVAGTVQELRGTTESDQVRARTWVLELELLRASPGGKLKLNPALYPNLTHNAAFRELVSTELATTAGRIWLLLDLQRATHQIRLKIAHEVGSTDTALVVLKRKS